MGTATIQFSESGSSLNGPDLITELPLVENPCQNPSFAECLPPFHREILVFTEMCFIAFPSQKSAPSAIVALAFLCENSE